MNIPTLKLSPSQEQLPQYLQYRNQQMPNYSPQPKRDIPNSQTPPSNPASRDHQQYSRQNNTYLNSNGTPLTFNLHSPYKVKLKKGYQRPSSRNQPQTKRQQTRKRQEQWNKRMEDFSKTTSRMINNWSNFGNRNNITPRTDNSIEVKNQYRTEVSTKNYLATDNRVTAEMNGFNGSFQKRSLKENYPSGVTEQNGVQLSTLLNQNQFQKKTIESLHHQIIKMKSQWGVQEVKAPEIFKRRSLQLQKQENSQQSQFRSPFQHDPNQLMKDQIEKLEKEIEGKNQFNLYLQQQCKKYIEQYQKMSHDLNQLKQKGSQKQEILKTELRLLKETSTSKDKFQSKNVELEYQNSIKNEEIERLKRCLDAQSNKLVDQSNNLQLNKSEINVLLMKLQNLQTRNDQLIQTNKSNTQKANEHSAQIERQLDQRKIVVENCQRQHQQSIMNLNEKIELIQNQKKVLEAKRQNQAEETKRIKRQQKLLQDYWKKQKNELLVQIGQRDNIIKEISQQNMNKEMQSEEINQLNQLIEEIRLKLDKNEQTKRQMALQLSHKEESLSNITTCNSQLVRDRNNLAQKIILMQEQLGTTKGQLQMRSLEGEEFYKKIEEQLQRSKEEIGKLTQQLHRKEQLQMRLLQSEEFYKKVERQLQKSKEEIGKLTQQLHRQVELKQEERRCHSLQLKTQVANIQQRMEREINNLTLMLNSEAENNHRQKIQLSSTISQLSNNISTLNQQKSILQTEISQKIIKEEQIIPKEVQNWGDQCDLQILSKGSSEQQKKHLQTYIQVDREGIQYICQLLGCQIQEQNILNTIVENLLKVLTVSSERQMLSGFYHELLHLLGITLDGNCQDNLIKEIQNLQYGIKVLMERIRELENNLQRQCSQKMMILGDLQRQRIKYYDVKSDKINLQSLNNVLNQQIIKLCVQKCNSRVQSRQMLKQWQQIDLKRQDDTSILQNDGFTTARSFSRESV